MPELPDIVVYIECLERRIAGARLDTVSVRSPALLKTHDPPLDRAFGRRVRGLRRIGKRIAIGLEGDFHLVLHLMIAGRLHWHEPGTAPPGQRRLAAFAFDAGTLVLSEAGTKRRASLHVVAGEDGLAALDPGGLEVLDASADAFAERLRSVNHTLKRALSGLRCADPADRPCRHRDQLLRALPVRWQAAHRPIPVPAAEPGLAALHRRA